MFYNGERHSFCRHKHGVAFADLIAEADPQAFEALTLRGVDTSTFCYPSVYSNIDLIVRRPTQPVTIIIDTGTANADVALNSRRTRA
jgi:hypothetical protein